MADLLAAAGAAGELRRQRREVLILAIAAGDQHHRGAAPGDRSERRAFVALLDKIIGHSSSWAKPY